MLPEDVAEFLKSMTSFREEVNSGTPQEWGESVREEADHAAELCKKHKLDFIESHAGDDYELAIYASGKIVKEEYIREHPGAPVQTKITTVKEASPEWTS